MAYSNLEKRRKYLSEYQRKMLIKRRSDWIESQGGRCVQCGSSERLEIDHINPAEKSVNPTMLWSRRAEIREAELIKCQVLCHECHKVKTAEANKTAVHGTLTMYTAKWARCRCDLCRAAWAAYAQQYRASKRQ